ncbi:uncharacterized protein LOC119074450 [Bradysia coprophila]|uniref:uncharacterized protein LOC119074450 n=1 Tax=Bradysia coprophila TaxID=38358 RepID=UPI00187DA2A4|nr:uncharacterized protein LOC119074450 [Bradysia coprophila]XP_037036478.1 uncharacterized protein LOC119074450 [Bradysia coprophila]
MFGLFVHRQNCAFMLYRPHNSSSHCKDNVVVSTFPAKLDTRQIHKGTSAIEYNYPSQTLRVKYSRLLCSDEFAQQLSLLCTESPALDLHKDYVSKWLVTLLADEASRLTTDDELPTITKKIRDDAIGTELNCFRRSSFYMCGKVMLQISLTIQVGAEKAKLIYKMVMLHFHSQMLELFQSPGCETLYTGLMSEAMAKLARRIEKLADLMSGNNQFDHMYGYVVDEAKSTIERMRHRIDEQIDGLQSEAVEQSTLPALDCLDFEADVCQNVPQLTEYIQSRVNERPTDTQAPRLEVTAMQRHYRDQDNVPDVKYLTLTGTSGTDSHVHLIDFENWILNQQLTHNDFDSDDLRRWSFAYSSVAEKFYKGDQLGSSKMILVRLKMIAILDVIAVAAHPLFKQHRCSVNQLIVESLLIPQHPDMEKAQELEKYFEKRNKVASRPGLIEEEAVTNSSFTARFAAQDVDMQNLRIEIENMAAEKTDEKRKEWEAGREKVRQLRNSARQLAHQTYQNGIGMDVHDPTCKRCQLEREARSVVIEEYEYPLPADEHLAHAVVFELRSPIEIVALRDVLAGFSKFSNNKSSKTLIPKGNWVDYHQVRHLNQSEAKFTTLGSTTDRKIESHHVDNDFEVFKVANGLNCVFYATNSTIASIVPSEFIKNACTMTTDGDYTELQWTLRGCRHHQNEVIARQSECPKSLTLSEYLHFGSLRADGHRLQLRKLYAMIECESLSFEKSSVLSLVMQTIWEAGSNSDSESYRDSFTDFDNSTFSRHMIELLDKFCEQQKDNWVHPTKMLMATLIAVRVYEINIHDDVADQIVNLLEKIRKIALNWIVRIEESLSDIKNPNIEEEQKLREILVLVCIVGTMTFYVHPQHELFHKIFMCDSPRNWLEFTVTICNSVLLNTNQQASSNVRLFLRLVRNIGIGIEANLKSIITSDPHDIYEFAKKQWKRAASGILLKHYFHNDRPQLLVFEVALGPVVHFITADLITGSFLVNNLPVARLPTNITDSQQFQRVFGNFVFEVQPTFEHTTFSAVQRYNECHYEFVSLEGNTLIIERRGDVVSELIPHEVLKGEIPHLLVENYSHFWNKGANTIEFRPKSFSDKNFSNEIGVEYRLLLDKKRLVHLKTRRFMLNINSNSYTKIIEQLARFEHKNYIHILMDEHSARIAKIELVRMQLKFRVDATSFSQSYDLVSNEFSLMRVSRSQNIGTLYGLQHGLLLESVPSEKNGASSPSSKMLLLPHGEIQTTVAQPHVTVKIDIESNLRLPPFHLYDVDEFCLQLKASNSSYSAWFYLAYLHAVTSHGEVEPFLKMSGTERALQILQSGFAWSSAPYDAEATKMLHEIMKLSPKRDMKRNIRSIAWPKFIPTHSAHDQFVIVASKLLEDSQRLRALHFERSKDPFKADATLQFNKQEYLRYLPLMPQLRISDTFVEHTPLKTSRPDPINIDLSQPTQIVAILYHRNTFRIPEDLNLKAFFKAKSKTVLHGMSYSDQVSQYLNHQVIENLGHMWLPLYECACRGAYTITQFTIILSALTHERKELSPILALQAVASNSNVFRSIVAPPYPKYNLNDGVCNATKVKTLLKRQYATFGRNQVPTIDINNRERNSARAVELLTNIVLSKWPCDKIDLEPYRNEETKWIDISSATQSLNRKLKSWYANWQLDTFIERVETQLQKLRTVVPVRPPNLQTISNPTPHCWEQYEIDFKNKMGERLVDFPTEIIEARSIWECNQPVLTRTSEHWWTVYGNIVNGPNVKHLIDAGIYPRVVPSLVLPQIQSTPNDLTTVIGALAVTIAHEQRTKRVQFYAQHQELQRSMEREEENKPHVNWKPCAHPEWLLFEIEQNLTIRRIQVEIANQMISPPDIGRRHSVMQLNMGEGKTSVIVPILASQLANGEQACQITVLKPLFASNLKSLRRYLGGMLNRKIYIFPCRRDMPISQHVDKILGIYEECRRERGVILTVPEYRLSFQLKIYEYIRKSMLNQALQFLTAHKWLNDNVRNILDESDAILHPKYQLIYTVGEQVPLDGGAHRWLAVQSVLKRVPIHMRAMHTSHGQKTVEFDRDYVKNGLVYGAPEVDFRSDVFTPCRILDEKIYEKVKMALIDDFLQGEMDIAFPEMTAFAKQVLRRLLSQRIIDKATLDAIMVDFSMSERNTIMILSGLLRFEVLKLVLMKRWRVNYGVNEKSQHKMAVPFKAKDVADMTEFGHPDVALCFTYLSYYYSGLTDEQLRETFNILSLSKNATSIYEKWVESVPAELINRTTIRIYSSVNLSDPHQRDELLFPLFRFNMHAIDFWLSNVVFPREAKAFETKLMCTAWDLCNDHLAHPVTGFSGTNDTKNILPLPIAQNDLYELESTNEEVRLVLLQQKYDHLPANISGKQIIEKLVRNATPVLLDAGALMLELNNREVATEWLKASSDESFDAAVYFDSSDVLQSIDRNGTVTEFDCSVYRDNLRRCLVYLDDVHTRGTDLKFPLDWKACVTLSGDITRDKTVQASMRMRQLGKGHSIVFWASYEADVRIRSICKLSAKSPVTSKNVVEFVCSKSKQFETEHTVHWTAGAHNYTKKLLGHKLHETLDDRDSLKDLYQKCADAEFIKLEDMYGDKEDALLSDIAKSKFNQLLDANKDNPEGCAFIESVGSAVIQKILKQAPNVRRFIQALDEEQEKELEHELEEECQIEKPPPMSPAAPRFDKMLRRLFSSSENATVPQTMINKNQLIPFHSSLRITHLIQNYAAETKAWSDHLYVTEDFMRVLKRERAFTDNSDCDEYLRPVWWIARVNVKNDKFYLILLSSYECDQLMPVFKNSKRAALHMFRPKLSKHQSNLLHETSLQVTGMTDSPSISANDEAQIAVYAGSMYFNGEVEQNAYCNFLGLIPRPRSDEHEDAFQQGIIKPNGFVPMENRRHSIAISDAVDMCKFRKNPVDLAIQLIETHHQLIREESHAASILKRGTKQSITPR